MSFEDELKKAREEERAAASGSSSKTPWSTQSWKPGASAGVSVPKTWDTVYSDTSTLQGISGVSDPRSYTWRESRQPSDVPNYYALSVNERDLFNAAAKSIHPLKTGEAFYGELIQASYDLSLTGIYKSPQELAYDAYEGSSDGGGDGKKGRYTGPVESRTIQAESDIRATANALAIELIGRPVSDKELNKLVERMRSAEMQQPNITTSTTGSTTTTQGLTAQGREDILREVIAKNPEYEKFQVDTTVLDAMTNFIDKKKQVSGG